MLFKTYIKVIKIHGSTVTGVTDVAAQRQPMCANCWIGGEQSAVLLIYYLDVTQKVFVSASS